MTRTAVGMIVGPGESLRYLDRTLRNASRWADEIIVYGDGPDADTWHAVGHYASHRHFDQQNRYPTDESAVRNGLFKLLDRVLTDGDIVVILDADEELWPLAGDSPASLLRTLAADRDADAWRVLFWHLWAPDGSVIRVDGMWRSAALYRIYRHRPGGRVPQRALACQPVPEGLAFSEREPLLAMAHWGYARPHDRILKHMRYMHLDGGRYHPLAHLQSIVEEPTLERSPYPISSPIARVGNPMTVDFVLVSFQDRGASRRIRRQLERTVGSAYTLTVVSNTRRNLGWAAACNKGALGGEGVLIGFLNQDLELKPGWFEPVIEALRADPRLVIAGPRCLDGGVWPRLPAGLEQWVCGACMLVRRDFFEQVGGFDSERFPHEYAETDLERTAVARGYAVRTIERSQVVHHYSRNKSKQVLRWRAQGARNEAEKWGIPIDRLGVGDEPPSVCLCMIVSNHEAVIERCIASAVSLIDRWVIVDTGSVDDTAQKLTGALDGIPGQLHHRPWVSSRHNRTELLELAFHEADYLLLLDPAWTVQGAIPPGLTADCYLVKQLGEQEFYKPVLMSGRRQWRFEGGEDEYITADEPCSRATLDMLVIDSQVAGGSRLGSKVEAITGLGSTSALRAEGRRGDVAIYCGGGWQCFSPDDIEVSGLGGAETAVVRLAEHLARELNYAVTVYGDVVEGHFHDVLFRDWRTFDAAERRDVVISSRTPEIADWGLNARVCMLWAHDSDFGTRLTPGRVECFDYVLCLSDWHRRHLADAYPFCAHKLRQIRNGIRLDYFQGPKLERAPRVLSTSAPDRGLDILLELWPRIRAEVPGAEFAYAYCDVYDRIAAERPEMNAALERVAELSGQDGVTVLGSLSQPELAELMRKSLVWAHPSFATTYGGPYPEVSCIGAMEAQAAGCVVVASDWGALSETVKVGRLVGGEPGSEHWRAALADEIANAVSNPETQAWAQREGPRAVAGLGWDGVARQVVGLIDSDGSTMTALRKPGRLSGSRRTRARPKRDTALSAGRPTICLNMIVRDEANIVRETLDSVGPWIDHLVVVDTGSSDGTIETIGGWMADNGVRGEIHERPWRDFGHNRSEALALAQGWADYIWVIDADDVLVGRLDLSGLCADSYLLRYQEGIRYWRKQIFRDGLRWRYEGLVHEYPVSDDPVTEERLTGNYHVLSRRLGARSRSPEKYARDAALLRNALERDRDDARAVFYLAQSCFDAGDFGEARHWYGQRAEMGGFAEEVFYSLMRCAACFTFENEPWERALGAYLGAHQARPVRAEPLYEIARHYRLTEDFDLGYRFAKWAAELVEPDDLLFVDTDVYQWKVSDELAVCAYHTGRYEECFGLCSDLLRSKALPGTERPRIVGNRDVCIPKLQGERENGPAEVEIGVPDHGLASAGQFSKRQARTGRPGAMQLVTQVPATALAELRIDVDPDWPCTGASIVGSDGGFTAVVRTSVESGSARSASLNYLVGFDEQFTVRSIQPMVGPTNSEGDSRSFDELRLIVRQEGVCASGLEYPAGGEPHAVLLRLQGPQIIDVSRVATYGAVVPPSPYRDGGKLLLVAGWCPTRVLDGHDGRLISDRPAAPLTAELQAGSNGLDTGSGWLFVASESQQHHRFVLLDRNHELAALSPAFSIAGGRQECCWGVARRGQELVLAFGYEHRSVGLAFLPLDDALALLEAR